MNKLPDAAAVADIIREVSRAEALSRFQSLAAHEITEKGPGDLVTIADLETERALERALGALLPGSVMVGEEAVAGNPGLLDALKTGDDLCWIIDPIDGTINYAHGVPLFATMVALVAGGEVVGGWIYDPVHDSMAMAEKGGGAYLDGRRIELGPGPGLARLSGCLHLTGYDRELAATAARNFDNVGPLLVLHCAGLEYQQMLNGRLHYAVYLRTNPWDHAPGLMLLGEAGGHTARLDGSAYDLNVIVHPSPLLAAVGEAAWHDLREHLFGLRNDM
ncbi:MAG: inositol monophosphatase [Alphaproteobacteria bacterium]|nr:inositol monophosphatase [Alphaproteobacteria bacterium]MDP6832236.1 inositol monophosphatase [Alphaproteobacteria bacterium]